MDFGVQVPVCEDEVRRRDPIALLSKEVGASKDVIRRWAIAYQEQGEAGYGMELLRRESRASGPVARRSSRSRKREPLFGVKRISHY